MKNASTLRMSRRALVMASAMLASGVYAQGNPKAIRIIVSFAPGSANDLIARDLARYMAELLNQPVIVENKPGAGGMIGTDAVAKAAPDGLTVGLGTSSQLVMNVGLYKTLPFDIEKDLHTIGLVARTNLVLVGKATGPKTLKALIAEAKARPGQISYGSGGTGSISHIVGEAFAKAADIKLNHVPYKGNGPAMADLAGGHVDLVFDGLVTAQPMAKNGRAHLIAISGTKRDRVAPDVPTFAEQGLPDYEAYTWNCLIAPAQTPADAMARINGALNKALELPALRDRLIDQFGSQILGPSTTAQAEDFGRKERERWVPFIRSLKLNVG
ncbi:Bug family tripartite tricarboxylate transporter substrate binding protein [Ottowia thiooxydans]|uniref:Bug family tripartite tricarboxylate transporter substrate binding protein n=1 Tax=Ottowia thiooxydans TaxID=219182 RepID=UPI0004068BB1|nr:tripartite tricarboxylate transporter substrate binding protein [Ottowia thiooxydans]